MSSFYGGGGGSTFDPTTLQTIKTYICGINEYDALTGLPTILNPDQNTFYLVPGDNGYNEYYYKNGNWELFGSADNKFDLSDRMAKGVDGQDNEIVGAIIEGSITGNNKNIASGVYSHAEGLNTTASGDNSHAEGTGTRATNAQAHAEGISTIASGSQAHAEGAGTTASGNYSHAEGAGTTASGAQSHAEGSGTTANHKSQHVFGEYNIVDASNAATSSKGNYVEIVGNGSSNNRSNARTLDWNGNEVLAGKLTVGTNPTNNMDVTPKKYIQDNYFNKQETEELFTDSTDQIVVISNTTPENTNNKIWIKEDVNEIQIPTMQDFNQLEAKVGSPFVASVVADMIDETRVYVYTGSENGYTFGNWYYYDGTNWTSGGVYNAIAIETDKTLLIENMAADAKATGDALATKAIADGVNEGMTAGNALQLASNTGVENTAPYFFRPVPADATREEVEVVGGSVVWNQYCKKDLTDSSYKKTHVTAEYNSNTGVSTVKGTAANDVQALILKRPVPSDSNNVILKPNHVYYAHGKVTSHVETADQNLPTFGFFWTSQGIQKTVGKITNGSTVTQSLIVKAGNGTSSSSQTIFQIRLPNSAPSTDYVDVEDLMLIDLTEALPSAVADYIYTLEQATAGAGVAWYQKYFGTDYYPYSAPTIKSVEGVSAHRMTGNNIFDSSQNLYPISIAGGNIASRDDKVTVSGNTITFAGISVDYGRRFCLIPVKKSQTYTVSLVSSLPWFLSVFSKHPENGESLTTYQNTPGMYYQPSNSANAATVYEQTITPTIDGYLYLGFPGTNGASVATVNDLQAENGSVAHVYEPYTLHTYPLDSDATLGGLLKVENGELVTDPARNDTYASDGTITTRWALVDMGTLNYSAGGGGYYTTDLHDVIEKGSPANRYDNLLSTRYIAQNVSSIGSLTDMRISIDSGFNVQLKDSTYETAAALKAGLSGVYLLYPLRNPTTSQATPYTTPQICAPGGTEEWVTTGVVPVGHRTWYPTNQVGKLDGLPKDFSTLIAPTEKTTKASRAYTVGSYFILNNTLYKVVSAIASGGTITPGTNCTATTIMAEIAAL